MKQRIINICGLIILTLAMMAQEEANGKLPWPELGHGKYHEAGPYGLTLCSPGMVST